jgi:hypothetical protein
MGRLNRWSRVKNAARACSYVVRRWVRMVPKIRNTNGALTSLVPRIVCYLSLSVRLLQSTSHDTGFGVVVRLHNIPVAHVVLL